MRTSSRLALAIHILVCISYFEGKVKVTSEFLSGSTGVNAVVIRNFLGRLKAAGLVEVIRGSGGASIAKSLDSVTFLEVYEAVEEKSCSPFRFHEHPNNLCPVGRNILAALEEPLDRVKASMQRELASIYVGSVKDRVAVLIDESLRSPDKPD